MAVFKKWLTIICLISIVFLLVMLQFKWAIFTLIGLYLYLNLSKMEYTKTPNGFTIEHDFSEDDKRIQAANRNRKLRKLFK